MQQKIPELYPSAPLFDSDHDLEQRLEKRLNDVYSFNNSVNDFEELITYLKDKNHKSKKKY